MDVQVQRRNIELPPQTLDYIDTKLQALQRRARLPMTSAVVVTREPTRSRLHSIVVEVTLNCNGSLLRAEERAPNVIAAVDAVVDVLARRVAHYKGKLYRSQVNRRSGKPLSLRDLESPPARPTDSEELPLGHRLVRTKQFSMEPMSVAAAATQMELLGHSFFLFHNRETETLNVLYRRWDGDYGLIEPEAT